MNNRRIIANGVVVDNRDLEATKTLKIQDFREQTSYKILIEEGIDEITQINVAMGIYNEDRSNEILNKIQYWRDKFLNAKQQIFNAQTLSEVDLVTLE